MSGDAPEPREAGAVLGADWPATTPAGAARALAVEALARVAPTATGLIEYTSAGRVLVIGPEPAALAAVSALPPALPCTVLAREAARAGPPAPVIGRRALPDAPQRSVDVVEADLQALAGHLGAFAVSVRDGERSVDLAAALGAPGPFDLVLDLGREPALKHELLPPGYFAPGRDQEAYARALEELPAMVGEYSKPAYVAYDPSICAHGERGLTGCTRCLDACPSGALTSIGERIAVDAHLCHGAGTCASVCPTGAMGYAYPGAPIQHERLRQAIGACHDGGEDAPVVLFVAPASEDEAQRLADSLPERVVPIEVEEIGSAGLDAWLAALAYGAAAVRLLVPASCPASVADAIDAQLAGAHAILGGLGLEPGRIDRLETAPGASFPGPITGERARHAPPPDKRSALRLALDRLHASAGAPADSVDLPAGMPFGEVRVDTDACTLCMACTAVCPTRALTPGNETPRLDFTEWSCVQCGLCERACPERAISLAPRLILDPEQRRRIRPLHEEPPFECVTCGKPFATRSVVERMVEKLGSHRMFQGEALERLKMCEDCRVKDMFRDGGGFDV